MPITPILPVTLDALRAIALGDGFREGRILEARVTAVLSNTLARIEIDGQPLMVTMTKPLPVGVALTLKVEREAGQLKLIAQRAGQGYARGAAPHRLLPTPPHGPLAFLRTPVKAALAKIQTMTVELMLDDNPAAEVALTQSLASKVGAQAVPPPHLAPRIPVQPGQNDAAAPAPLGASGEDTPERVERSAARIERPNFARFMSRPMR